MDWGSWSREAATQMAAGTAELFARHGIVAGSAYKWNLDAGVMTLGGVTFGLVAIGTVAGDSFLWAWANDTIPPRGKVGIDRVREFGVEHGLGLLVEPCAPGGLSQARECLAIAWRVLDADAAWIAPTDTGFILFVLRSTV
jgi:hypothetical protein